MKDAPKIARHRCGNNLHDTVANAVQDGIDANAKTMLHDAKNGHETVGGNAGPLLELEPPTVEKVGENSNSQAEPASPACYAPLLGTSYSQSIENARGSSERRSPEGVCYSKLLRDDGLSSAQESQKTVRLESRGC